MDYIILNQINEINLNNDELLNLLNNDNKLNNNDNLNNNELNNDNKLNNDDELKNDELNNDNLNKINKLSLEALKKLAKDNNIKLSYNGKPKSKQQIITDLNNIFNF